MTSSDFTINNITYTIYNLPQICKKYGIDAHKLPFSMKILLENVARTSTESDIKKIAAWQKDKGSAQAEIEYKPARVLMQDFTGIPAVVDFAAMRDAVKKLGGNVDIINPLAETHLVIDHSIQVDFYAGEDSASKNMDLEMQRNRERYEFLKWGQNAFDNFKVVPPGTGICHQVNLENIAKVVWTKSENGKHFAFFDTLVGTDSHTTMVNGLGVLGWGVGGIEAESVMLGESISLVLPEVIGFKLIGKPKEGVTATDIVLTITQQLRKKGVVGKFVEFFGHGIQNLTLADRATIANMAPEYGATCGIFPIDKETISYLELTGRSQETIDIVNEYTKLQAILFNPDAEPEFTDVLELDLSSIEPCVAGPKRPQDRLTLKEIPQNYKDNVQESHELDGSIALAAITSCTNTSNPAVLIAAGLLAKKSVELGLQTKPHVKTSLAPGSRVAEEYLIKSGLQYYLDALGFNIVGFGCTTCIGNSGPLESVLEKNIIEKNLTVAAVLSGNRNFEGRVHPLIKLNYLASPPLVVAFALMGHIKNDITSSQIGTSIDGKPIFLKDIWPSNAEISDIMSDVLNRKMFESKYANVFDGTKEWQNVKTKPGKIYSWGRSTYIENPPYFDGMTKDIPQLQTDIKSAKALLILGDSITTDHISPAGSIGVKTPAAKFLMDLGVKKEDFNSYGARRGSHSVMMRGTFANTRLKNEIINGGPDGGYTKDFETGEITSVYDYAVKYNKTPLLVFAGKEYGTGSSRDWAAKGTYLLGVKAVIAESFERIHRSNLIGMGVIPFEFINNETRKTLNLIGDETFDITCSKVVCPRSTFNLTITRKNGEVLTTKILARIDTERELEYLRHGGIMPYVIRNMLAKNKKSGIFSCIKKIFRIA